MRAVLLIEMDAYTGPPLAAVYDLADGLPVGSDASKVIAVPMVAKETRIQVDTPDNSQRSGINSPWDPLKQRLSISRKVPTRRPASLWRLPLLDMTTS